VLTSLIFRGHLRRQMLDLLFPNATTFMICGNSLSDLNDLPANVVALHYGNANDVIIRVHEH